MTLVGRESVFFPRQEDPGQRRFLAFVVMSLAVGVVVRLLLIWTTTSSTDTLNHLYPGFTDGEEYLDNAHSLLETGVYGYGGRASAFRPPAYPFLMTICLWLFGESMTPIRILQIGLFVLMSILYVHVTAKHFGRWAGVLVVCLLSLYPLFAFMTTEIATENLYMALEAALFLLALSLFESAPGSVGATGVAFLAGLLCGAGTLTRPNMLVILPLLMGLVVVGGQRKHVSWRTSVPSLLALALGACLVLLPWMIRNERRFGAPVITTNLYYNLFRGTFDLVEGIPENRSILDIFREHHVVYEEEIEDVRIKKLSLDEGGSERNARAAALAIIRADPLGWIWQRMRNALYLWLNLQWDSHILRSGSIVSIAALMVTLIYYVVLAGALAGTLFLWRLSLDTEQKSFIAIAWCFIAAAMPTSLTFVGKRYRVSMIDPYLILLVCVALELVFARRRPSAGEDPTGTS